MKTQFINTLLKLASIAALCWGAQAAPFSTSSTLPPGGAAQPFTTIFAYCRPTTFGTCTTIASVPGNTQLNATQETTVVTKINQSQLGSFTQVTGVTQIALNNPNTGHTTPINNLFIGPGNTTGSPNCQTGSASACPFNFDTTPTRVTCGGANSFTLTPTTTGQNLCAGTDTTAGITFLDPVSFNVSTSQAFMLAFDLAGAGWNVNIAPTVSPVNTFKASTISGNWNGYFYQIQRQPISTSYNSGTGILTLIYTNAPFDKSVGSNYNGQAVTLAGWTPSSYNGSWTITNTSGNGTQILVGTHAGLAAVSVIGTMTLQQAKLQFKTFGYTTQQTPIVDLINRIQVQ